MRGNIYKGVIQDRIAPPAELFIMRGNIYIYIYIYIYKGVIQDRMASPSGALYNEGKYI